MADTIAEVADLKVPDGEMATFSYRPAGEGKHPAVIVIQEIFGVEPHIQDVAHRLAAEGYFATAPDLFHRSGRHVTVSFDDRDTAFGHRGKITDEGTVDDLNAVMEYLKSNPNVDANNIGIVGFCFGGRVSFLAAARVPGLSASVVYYGGGIIPRADAPPGSTNLLDEVGNITAPMIGFFGDQDQAIPAEQVKQIDEAMQKAGKDAQFTVYPGAGHGFFCDIRGSYHESSAKDSWPKTLAFFGKHLKGTAVGAS